jgi:hypothetical protein
MRTQPFATGHCPCRVIDAAPIGIGRCHREDRQRSSDTGRMPP